MRRILKRREFVEDTWVHLGEVGSDAVADDVALIVPWAEFRVDADRWKARTGQLGVRLVPADAAEDLADYLPHLALVACEFPGPGEGRGYTQARLLRSRLAFAGEVRAVGPAVKQDLLFIMSRCGFDSFELAPGQPEHEALAALDRYSVAYQPAETVPSIHQQRLQAIG